MRHDGVLTVPGVAETGRWRADYATRHLLERSLEEAAFLGSGIVSRLDVRQCLVRILGALHELGEFGRERGVEKTHIGLHRVGAGTGIGIGDDTYGGGAGDISADTETSI